MRAVRRGYAKPETLCKLAPALMFDTEGYRREDRECIGVNGCAMVL